jgi:hypothetical protein
MASILINCVHGVYRFFEKDRPIELIELRKAGRFFGSRKLSFDTLFFFA